MPKNKKSSKKSLDIIVLVVVFVVAAFVGGFFAAGKLIHREGDEKAVINDSTVSDKTSNKENSIDQHDPVEIVKDENKTPEKYDGDDANNFGELSGTVTYAGIAGNKLMIRVNIDQFLTSGTCSIEIGSYSNSVNISSSASTSTCEGFDIALSDLSGTSGEVDFSINLSSGEKQGLITGSVQL